jgi:hypothetical protein
MKTKLFTIAVIAAFSTPAFALDDINQTNHANNLIQNQINNNIYDITFTAQNIFINSIINNLIFESIDR